jgi:TonB family protein
MQRTRFAGLFLTSIALCAPALAQEPPPAPPAQGTPAVERLSPPTHRDFRMPLYPASEREAKHTGYVDVAMVVSAEGRLVEIKSTTSEPKNAVFEQVTQDAVAEWRFVPGMNQRCAPAQTEVTYRVIFENAYGSDHVRAVPLRSPPSSSSASQTGAPRREIKPRTKPKCAATSGILGTRETTVCKAACTSCSKSIRQTERSVASMSPVSPPPRRDTRAAFRKRRSRPIASSISRRYRS